MKSTDHPSDLISKLKGCTVCYLDTQYNIGTVGDQAILVVIDTRFNRKGDAGAMHLSSQSQFGRLKISVGTQLFSTATEQVWCIAGAQPDIDLHIATPIKHVLSAR